MNIIFSPTAWAEYTSWLKDDRRKQVRINELLKDIACDSYIGIGKPEPLRHEFSGYWSRRIDDEHRLVYTIEDDNILIAKCRFHYGD